MARDKIEVIVRGVAIVRGHILLCRNRKRGHVFLPGGHVEWGESASAALRREMLEETGMRVVVERSLGFAEERFIQQGKRRHEVNLVFGMRLPDAAGRRMLRRAVPRPPASREAKLEFLWAPLSVVRGPGRSVRLLPPSVRGLLRRLGPG